MQLIFDIDNHGGQKTSYLFEPIPAGTVEGVPASAGKSLAKRR